MPGGRDNSSQGPGGLGELFIGARKTRRTIRRLQEDVATVHREVYSSSHMLGESRDWRIVHRGTEDIKKS